MACKGVSKGSGSPQGGPERKEEMRDVRFTINVEPGTAEVLRRTSKATGQSVSGIVSDLLDQIAPVLARVAALKEMAERAQTEAVKGMLESMEGVRDELEPLLVKALGVMGVDAQEGVDGDDGCRRVWTVEVGREGERGGSALTTRAPAARKRGRTPGGVITGVTKVGEEGKARRKASS
jgi:hypothetical protein